MAQSIHQTFQTFFGKKQKPQFQIFSPYRACPIGAHSDHQHGIITGFAFDKGMTIIGSATQNALIQMLSFEFTGLVSFYTNQQIPQKQENWGDYIKGAVISLRRFHLLPRGIKAVVQGSIPVGGLSSSAALLCGIIMALARVNNIEINKMDIIKYASYAQRQYVGLRNGILDQSCVILSKASRLLYLDTKTQEYELLPFGDGTKPIPFEIGIYFSGVTRKLTDTNFNMRVAECKVAAWMLYSYENIKLNQLQDTRLREISEQVFHKHQDKMPDSFRKRATHFYTQFNRVKKGLKAWKQGDIVQFGKLIFQSCQSSKVNFQCSSPQLNTIFQLMKSIDGIYGGRFSGAGFKGACISLIDPSKKKQIEEQMTCRYLSKFPEYKQSFKVYFCKLVDGANFVSCKDYKSNDSQYPLK